MVFPRAPYPLLFYPSYSAGPRQEPPANASEARSSRPPSATWALAVVLLMGLLKVCAWMGVTFEKSYPVWSTVWKVGVGVSRASEVELLMGLWKMGGCDYYQAAICGVGHCHVCRTGWLATAAALKLTRSWVPARCTLYKVSNGWPPQRPPLPPPPPTPTTAGRHNAPFPLPLPLPFPLPLHRHPQMQP